VNAEDTRPVGAARAARLTKNEALFREVNERIHALNDFGAQAERFSVVCECGQETCADVIQVNRDFYETVRAQSDRFIVVNGHVLPEIETVVEQHEGFAVVDKHDGIPEKIAAQTDPRA
jgi:5-bromo-4-chloroindolyl phosphate hydrolysis protein